MRLGNTETAARLFSYLSLGFLAAASLTGCCSQDSVERFSIETKDVSLIVEHDPNKTYKPYVIKGHDRPVWGLRTRSLQETFNSAQEEIETLSNGGAILHGHVPNGDYTLSIYSDEITEDGYEALKEKFAP